MFFLAPSADVPQRQTIDGKNVQEPVYILGAGCAGLTAGLRLLERRIPCVLVEKDDHVGGLAGGIRLNGNVYEYGPHIFHTTDPEIKAFMKALMGTELIPYERTIKVKFLDQYFKFPLSIPDVLFKLPRRTVVRAFFSFLYEFIKGAIFHPPEANSETVLKRYYGNVLYEIFFKNYIERVWGISPAEFSPAFARQRIPRLNLLETLEKLTKHIPWPRRRPAASDNYVEKVEGDLYTTRQGFSLITQRMEERFRAMGGTILLNTTVQHLEREGNRVVRVLCDGPEGMQTLSCRAVINTLPLNETLACIQPPLEAEGVAEACQALDFRALVFVGLLVRRRPVLPSSFMYFREHSFNRISDLSYFNFDVHPAGASLLVAEVTCAPGERAWTDETFITDSVIQDLLREKLLRQDEILESHVFRARHAYPVYKLHYERHLATLLKATEQLKNAETAGRQGRFQYVNIHVVMRMAFDSVERLLAKIDSPKN
jgi:protoporphyrinogen oxidase